MSGPCQHGRFLSGGHRGTRCGEWASPPAGSLELWPPRDKGRPSLSHKAPPAPAHAPLLASPPGSSRKDLHPQCLVLKSRLRGGTGAASRVMGPQWVGGRRPESVGSHPQNRGLQGMDRWTPKPVGCWGDEPQFSSFSKCVPRRENMVPLEGCLCRTEGWILT